MTIAEHPPEAEETKITPFVKTLIEAVKTLHVPSLPYPASNQDKVRHELIAREWETARRICSHNLTTPSRAALLDALTSGIYPMALNPLDLSHMLATDPVAVHKSLKLFKIPHAELPSGESWILERSDLINLSVWVQARNISKQREYFDERLRLRLEEPLKL